jgi:hypothetical protein
MGSPADSFEAMDSAARSMKGRSQVSGSTVDCPNAKKVRIRIVLKDAAFRIFRNKKFELEAAGHTYTGDTGDTGLIDQLIPAAATTGKLSVWLYDSDTPPAVWPLEFGVLDPMPLESGAKERLANLAFDDNERQTELDDMTEDFQTLFGLKPTGELDSETMSLLKKVYSSASGPDVTAEARVWPDEKLLDEIANEPPTSPLLENQVEEDDDDDD